MSEDKNKVINKMAVLRIVIISLLVVSVVLIISYFYEVATHVIKDKDSETLNRFQCEQWIQEGKFIVNKNSPEINPNLWSEEDKIKISELSEKVLENCTVTKKDVIKNIDFCVEKYKNIQELLAKMVDLNISSLSDVDQKTYHDDYDIYFKSDCDVIEDEIKEVLKTGNN